jgi:hypothetical protein
LLQRSLLFVIDPVDAAAVPNGLRIVVAGSDADGFDEENGGIISAGDLTHGVSYVGFGEDYVAYLRRHHEVSTKSEIIFVLETLALVSLACERCSVWRDSLVFFAVDSDNAKHAVNNKTSRNAYVRYLLAILTMLEVRFHFRIVVVYVWTKHNVFFDQIGRRLKRDDADWLKSAQEYADTQAPGMVVKEFTTLLDYFTRGGSVMNALALPWDRPGSASALVPWPTMPEGDATASSEASFCKRSDQIGVSFTRGGRHRPGCATGRFPCRDITNFAIVPYHTRQGRSPGTLHCNPVF